VFPRCSGTNARLEKEKIHMNTTQLSGRRPGPAGRRRRLAVSLTIGALAAGALVAWDGGPRHKALVAAAAAPEPKGVHETAGSILASGGIVTFLVVTGLVFAVATVVARRRSARQAATVPMYAQPGPRRRGRTYARW
jgi:hypothetical protein